MSSDPQQQTTALRWVEAGAGYIACCGEHQQGEVIIRDAEGGGYLWHVDMLPLDAEPAVFGLAATVAEAKAAAERQVAKWPALAADRHQTPESPMPRPRLGKAQIETLACIARPTTILLTPKKRDQRLVDLGLAKHPVDGCESLCITPAGLRYLADEIEAGRVKDGEAWAAERRAKATPTTAAPPPAACP